MRVDDILNQIYEFIEKKSKEENGNVIFSRLSNMIFEEFGVSISPTRTKIICLEISEDLGIPLTNNKKGKKHKDKIDIFDEAEDLGFTDEEVYISRSHGYSYQAMCELYYELTGKLIDPSFFQSKYKNYCKKNGIPIQARFKIPENVDFLQEIKNDGKQHSSFFIQLHSKCIHRSRSTRQVILDDVHSPYKKPNTSEPER